MRELEKRSTKLLHATDELRQLIIDNPELPLLVFAGEDVGGTDYAYVSCSYCSAQKGEFLDCWQTVNDELCFIDRVEFQEEMAECLADDAEGLSDEEFDAKVDAEVAEYDPYWKPCIILYVND